MPTNQIYFAQHGLAVDKSENPDRPLSAEGIRQTQAIADQLKNSSIPVSQIFHSGKLRAQQTTDIFAIALSAPSTFHDDMAPMDNCNKLISNLKTDNVLYVGHLPHLDKVISTLVTKDESSKVLQFVNSGIVCLSQVDNNDSGYYSISWYLAPELLHFDS